MGLKRFIKHVAHDVKHVVKVAVKHAPQIAEGIAGVATGNPALITASLLPGETGGTPTGGQFDLGSAITQLATAYFGSKQSKVTGGSSSTAEPVVVNVYNDQAQQAVDNTTALAQAAQLGHQIGGSRIVHYGVDALLKRAIPKLATLGGLAASRANLYGVIFSSGLYLGKKGGDAYIRHYKKKLGIVKGQRISNQLFGRTLRTDAQRKAYAARAKQRNADTKKLAKLQAKLDKQSLRGGRTSRSSRSVMGVTGPNRRAVFGLPDLRGFTAVKSPGRAISHKGTPGRNTIADLPELKVVGAYARRTMAPFSGSARGRGGAGSGPSAAHTPLGTVLANQVLFPWATAYLGKLTGVRPRKPRRVKVSVAQPRSSAGVRLSSRRAARKLPRKKHKRRSHKRKGHKSRRRKQRFLFG